MSATDPEHAGDWYANMRDDEPDAVPVAGAVGACVLNGCQNAEWSAVAREAIASRDTMSERVLDALHTRYRRVDALRRGSGGTDDPNTGATWYRAQCVALRDMADALGYDSAALHARDEGQET